MPHILIVDDELSMREFLKILFEKDGYEVSVAKDAATALKITEKKEVSIVLSDIRMPGMNGLELLAELKHRNPELPVIMITAFASPDDAVLAMKHGAFDYITKPFKVDEIKEVIRTAVKRSPDSADLEKTRDTTFTSMIGNSAEMVKIFDLIKRIAPTPANVLIYGESGTGKELVAQAIHDYSKVSANPFVPITCSSIPESLLESELFGHVKGSFTGAIADKAGLFQQADSGTAFLDEIGEIPSLIQTKLLRVLQEREFMPVGSTRIQQVNVRIIAATNRILEEEILAGNFREDLYYRLAVVPIRVPPLRERKGDVPLLVDHFLKKYSKLFGKEVQKISSYGLEVLMDYNFPGNVRELENIIERGVAMESSNIILPESLILSRREKSSSEKALFVAAMDEAELFERGIDDILTSLETKMIQYAMEKADGSKMQAAKLLKLSFRSLRYKTKKFDLD